MAGLDLSWQALVCVCKPPDDDAMHCGLVVWQPPRHSWMEASGMQSTLVLSLFRPRGGGSWLRFVSVPDASQGSRCWQSRLAHETAIHRMPSMRSGDLVPIAGTHAALCSCSDHECCSWQPLMHYTSTPALCWWLTAPANSSGRVIGHSGAGDPRRRASSEDLQAQQQPQHTPPSSLRAMQPQQPAIGGTWGL
jgi:hypothetical protein